MVVRSAKISMTLAKKPEILLLSEMLWLPIESISVISKQNLLHIS